MLTIIPSREENTLKFNLTGRIDSSTAPDFEKLLFSQDFTGVDRIVFDFSNLDFISSAGLRVLLTLRNQVGESVSIEGNHVNASVREVFELTGFGDIITVMEYEENPNITAVFFDIDGTLLSHRTGEIPQSTKDALFQLKDRGIHRIICTGRDLVEMQKLPGINDLPFDGYLTLNGNLCLDGNKEMFAGNEIDPGEVEVLVRIFKASRIPFVLIGEKKRYINYIDDIVIDTQASTKGTLPDIGEYNGEKIYQCLAFVKDKERLMLEDMLDECTITSWNDTGIDIISKHGGKASGIEKFVQRYGLRRGETMAFGDGQNDIDMIRYAGIGVAMGNGIDALKRAANYVTTDIDDNGIANALKHFGLIE